MQAQEKQKDEKATHQHQEQDVYTCEMHPEVKSDKPGKCPKCGMNLTKLSSAESNVAEGQNQQKVSAAENIKEAKRLLFVAKGQLAREGRYNCCIEVPCNQCAMDHQSCPCYEDLKNGKPVCNECYGGWQRGEGKDKKIDPKKVKTNFSDHKH
jgi:hypothetical protein